MENSYNSNDKDFKSKMKQFFSNRAVVVTIVTLLLALTVLIAVTVAASRSRRPAGSEDGTEAGTSAGTTQDAFADGEATQPVYNGNDTLPVGGAETTAPQSLSLSLPVQGTLTKGHDATLQVYSSTMGDYRVHLGLDIATAENAPVYAAADGTVEKIWEDAMMGYCVALSHGDDTLSVYKNLSTTLADGITVGQTVKAGQQIGCVGDTATLEMAEEPHLHFEMTVGGLQVDPLDYFSEADVAVLTARGNDNAYESSAVTGSNSAK